MFIEQKEENFDNVCCESSQPTVEQDSPQRWSEDESSSVHRETVAFTMQQQQRRQQQSRVSTSENTVELQKRTESFEKTKLGLQFLDDRRAEKHSFETLIFKYVYFDTVMKVERENW